MAITGFSELKKRQKLQEQETLQHQKRISVSTEPSHGISSTIERILCLPYWLFACGVLTIFNASSTGVKQ